MRTANPVLQTFIEYATESGGEVVVFCPESKDALGTQQPAPRRLNEDKPESATKGRDSAGEPYQIPGWVITIGRDSILPTTRKLV